MRVFDSGPGTGSLNMETDQRLLAWVEANPGDCTLRFFGWSEPTLTIGRTQYSLISPSPSPLPRLGRGDIVKRPTGGGLVLHQPGEMSFSFCWGAEPNRPHLLSNTEGTRGIYKSLHLIFKEALEKLGCNCKLFPPHPTLSRDGGEGNKTSECFRDYVESDIMQEGKKVAGGALWRTKKAFLYQGTLKINEVKPEMGWDQVRQNIAATLEKRLGLKAVPEDSWAPV